MHVTGNKLLEVSHVPLNKKQRPRALLVDFQKGAMVLALAVAVAEKRGTAGQKKALGQSEPNDARRCPTRSLALNATYLVVGTSIRQASLSQIHPSPATKVDLQSSTPPQVLLSSFDGGAKGYPVRPKKELPSFYLVAHPFPGEEQ